MRIDPDMWLDTDTHDLVEHKGLPEEADRNILDIVDDERLGDLQRVPKISKSLPQDEAQTHLKLPHRPRSAAIAEVHAHGEVVVIVTSLVSRDEFSCRLKDGLGDAPSLLGFDVVRKGRAFGLSSPKGFRVGDGSGSGELSGVGLGRRGEALLQWRSGGGVGNGGGDYRRGLCAGTALEEPVVEGRTGLGTEEEVSGEGVLVLTLVAEILRVEGTLNADDGPNADGRREEGVKVLLERLLGGLVGRREDHFERQDIVGSMYTGIGASGAREADLCSRRIVS